MAHSADLGGSTSSIEMARHGIWRRVETYGSRRRNAAELAVAPDAAQHRLAGHPSGLRRAGEPWRSASKTSFAMKIKLIPLDGTLSARVFGNPHIDLKPTLFYDIEIPLAPFTFEGSLAETSIRLEFIEFGLKSWRDLSGAEFSFPRNPENGYIDGSIYLANVHNPIDTTRIAFGSAKPAVVPASFDLEIDFTFEGPARLGIVEMSFDTNLAFDPGEIESAVTQALSLRGQV
jgi:hypothetical protein